jgi:hypothetical protein
MEPEGGETPSRPAKEESSTVKLRVGLIWAVLAVLAHPGERRDQLAAIHLLLPNGPTATS